MPIALTQTASIRNRILTGLPREKYPDLFANLRLVSLSAQEVLYCVEDEIRCVYFINSGMASFMSISSEGHSIEVCNAGNEGMVGVPVLLRQIKAPYQVLVQVPGDAWLVSADILRK